jgi:hypothetical protein
MVHVTFALDLFTGDDYQTVSEADLRAAPDSYRDLIRAQETLEGSLRIEANGQPPVEISDELWAAVQNLCFTAVSALLDPERDCFLYRKTNVDSHIVLISLGPVVRLMGEDIPAATFPASELLPALTGCGLRIVDLYRSIGGAAAEFVHYLQPYADQATAALASHGMHPPVAQ